ncbi:hypothetical protein ABZV58_27930 [Nocardia sp. NPDC004654]|uniref:hypothetical protein n=1 Tax=Nocardia sp. NPDC004654 TaxID=3154776 RepID=UPI0033A15BFE
MPAHDPSVDPLSILAPGSTVPSGLQQGELAPEGSLIDILSRAGMEAPAHDAAAAEENTEPSLVGKVWGAATSLGRGAIDFVTSPFEGVGTTFDQASSVRAGRDGIGPTAPPRDESATSRAVIDTGTSVIGWVGDLASGLNPYPETRAAFDPMNPTKRAGSLEDQQRFTDAIDSAADLTVVPVGRAGVVLLDTAYNGLQFDNIMEGLHTKPGPDGTLYTPDFQTRPQHHPLEVAFSAVVVASLAFPAASAIERVGAAAAGRQAVQRAAAQGATREEAIAAGERAVRDYLLGPFSAHRGNPLGPPNNSTQTVGEATLEGEIGAVLDFPWYRENPRTFDFPSGNVLPGMGAPRAPLGQSMAPTRLPQFRPTANSFELPKASSFTGDPLPLNEVQMRQLAAADRRLRNAGMEVDDIYGTAWPTHPGRLRLAKVMQDTRFGSKIAPVLDSRAFRFALENGGYRNPREFADLFEYYSARFHIVKKEAQENAASYPNRSLDAVAVENMDDSLISADLARDIAYVESGVRQPAFLSPTLDGAALEKAVRQLEYIGFGRPATAAYHPYKHYKEIPPEDALGVSILDEYFDSAAKTVREGTLGNLYVQSNGSRTLIFQRTFVDSDGNDRVVQAIVNVDANGRAILATYGRAKSRK